MRFGIMAGRRINSQLFSGQVIAKAVSVMWFRFGNSTNKTITKTFLFYQSLIVDFINNDSLGILEIKEAIY